MQKGEWVITYTPPGGGIGHSRALSWYAPDILNNHDAIKEVREKAKKVIASQLTNPNHPNFVHRWEHHPHFGLCWIEKHDL